jgi:hypothetical protein
MSVPTDLIGEQGPGQREREERSLEEKPTRYGWHIDAIVLLAVVLLSALYVGSLLRVGWIPNDEGTLAQSALRVYQGQLPQRDFADVYTGGLSFIHAAAFRLFGVNLFSLRLSAFAFFLAWLPALYYVARRFVAPLGAGLITLVAVAWSYPNYVAAMPSWYNLFLATFGAAALLRYLEVSSRRWLFVAGLCGGASVLVKVIGFYYVAAVLLFLLFVEQSRQEPGTQQQPPLRPQALGKDCRGYRVVCGGLLGVYLAMLLMLIWPQMRGGEVYHFLLPSALCVALLLWRERGPAGMASRERFAALFGLVGPFVLGIAAIFLVFVIPYVASGSTLLLIRSITSSTAVRVASIGGRQHAPAIRATSYGLAVMALILFAMYAGWARKRAVAVAAALGLLIALRIAVVNARLDDAWVMKGTFVDIHLHNMWLTAGTLTPLAVLLGVWMILVGPRWEAIDRLAQQRIMLMISLAAVCSLVQFPFSWVTYFCYTAPLTLLAVVAAVSARRNPPGKLILGALLCFYLGFGVLVMVARHVYNPDLQPEALQALRLPRAGGLKVDVTSAYVDATTTFYEELIPFLQAHSPNGLMYAGNDCPDLYFLSGLKNPTRDDSGAPTSDVLKALRSGDLQLVVINDKTFFAGGVTLPELREEIALRLHNTKKLGRFSIYWR